MELKGVIRLGKVTTLDSICSFTGKACADRRPRRSRQEVLRNRYTHIPVIVSFTLGYGLIHVPKFGIVELYHLRNL